MQDLWIVGASGSSLDIIDVVEDINARAPTFRLRGLLDDDPGKAGQSFGGLEVCGTLADAAGRDGQFVLGIASAANRRLRASLAARMGVGRERFASIIHPSAEVSRRAILGAGVVLLHHVVIGPRAVLGDHVLLCAAVTVGHDARLGEGAIAAPHVAISGGVSVGSGAYLGSGARLKDGISVGEGAMVGIGAVAVSAVKPGETVFGNPARRFF